MSQITVVGVDGQRREIEYTNGDSLMEVLRDAGYEEIAALCGGCCSCATCHVKISDQEKFSIQPVEENEGHLLEMADEYDPQRSRLSCQVFMDDLQEGMVVQVVDAF